MSERPFLAARIEEALNRRTEGVLRLFGWREKVIPYAGYGTTDKLRVMGRVVMTPPEKTLIPIDLEALMARRGWRNFMAIPAVKAPVKVTVGDQTHVVWTDRGGYLDTRITNPGLEPGWRSVQVRARLSEAVESPVQVVGEGQRFGLISDIDDTVITTWLPRLLIAAYNSFWLTEGARQPVRGMAELYAKILAERPDSPVIYISTGSYDTYAFLTRFLAKNGFPRGTLLMTDWGPTNTGWFRSGQEHKRRSLRQLAADMPKIKWLLVGDDGQHDPELYADFAQHLPKRVRGIAIRQLSETEHTLAHGTPTELRGQGPHEPVEVVTEVRAPDGFGLWQKLEHLVRKKNRAASEPDAPQG